MSKRSTELQFVKNLLWHDGDQPPNHNPANLFTITKAKVTFKGRFQDSKDVKNITAKKKRALVLESKQTFRLHISNVKSTIPAFKACVFDEQYGKHFWTMLGSLQCVDLVMNICHLLFP